MIHINMSRKVFINYSIADKIEIKVKLEVTLTSKMTMAIELVSFFVVSRNLLGAEQPTIPENQPIIDTKNRLL